MSVKSTQYITRLEAEKMFVELSLRREKAKRKYRAKAALLSNVELEDKLEVIHDEVNGGEGYENYIIRDSE